MRLLHGTMAAACFGLLAAGLLGACSGADDTTGGAGGGSASVECGPGAELCGDACVDTMFEPAHCGGCDSACGDGLLCSEGSCVLECTGGTTKCGDRCVDTENDRAHCGECDNACDGDAVCVEGGCVAVCRDGELMCGSLGCVDITSNAKACGSCDNACGAGEICRDSECMEAPLLAVSGMGQQVDGMFIVDTDSGETEKIASFNAPVVSAVFKDGQLYGVQPGGSILHINHTTGVMTTVAQVLGGGPRDLALLRDGRLLTCDENDHRFVAVDVETGAATAMGIGGGNFGAGGACEHEMGFGSDGEGNLFGIVNGTLFAFDESLSQASSSTPLSEAGIYKGLTFHRGALYAVRMGAEQRLVKINTKTGKVDDIGELPESVEGLASAAP